jgi:hypothetical protein
MLWIPAESARLLVILTGQMRSGICNRERIDEHDAVAQGGVRPVHAPWQRTDDSGCPCASALNTRTHERLAE